MVEHSYMYGYMAEALGRRDLSERVWWVGRAKIETAKASEQVIIEQVQLHNILPGTAADE